MQDGASAEIAIVGKEGLVGIALFMGGETTPSRAIVQSAGCAFRLDARLLKEEFYCAVRCSICSCGTPKRCSRKWGRRRCANGIIQWTSNSVAGC
jgi:hypothetical protein